MSEEALKIIIGVLIVIAVVAAAVITGGCKQKTGVGPESGKCEPLFITAGSVTDQRCAWRGYWWRCTGDDANRCERGETLPQEAPVTP